MRGQAVASRRRPGATLSDQEFFEQVPRLFWACHAREETAYHLGIYLAHRPPDGSEVARALAFRAPGPAPAVASDLVRDFQAALADLHYPDAKPLLRLARHGLDARQAASLAHFELPSYPLYEPLAVKGLLLLGRVAPMPGRLDEPGLRGYRTFMQQLDELKEAVPFTCVPEAPYYLSRVVEAALTELAVEQSEAAK
ncbi:MAG TPA: hypothetical protein VM681_01445 [Candidatus Thermoplasmatota archaeon]|nr:hypothetical protein [Candidatus Thermoplasmatota archaeon]